ncbi:MAG: LCP family protein [Clostridiales bacterium]|nr:LCP family protein [Clostridiales bacterium]
MRKLLCVLLAFSICLCGLPAFAEGEVEPETAAPGGRGVVEVIGGKIEGEDDPTDEFDLMGDQVVFDPIDEIALDDVAITNALDTLDGVRNILLLGLDSRTSAASVNQGRTGYLPRSDTMMLLSVDIEKKTIKLVSFLRDLYVEIPGKKNNRLNAAYVFGGFDLLAKTLEKNFGVKPDAYVAVNLAGLVDVIDQLGGLYIDVPAKKVDRVNAVIYWYNDQVLGKKDNRSDFLTHGGYQLLNGKQAEAWARYRYSESDFQRTERQRKLIELIFEKITQMSVSDLASFAINNIKLVRTSLTLSEITKLAPAVLAMKDAEIQQLTIPRSNAYTSQTISGMAVLVPDRNKNIKALREFYSK